MMFKLPLKLALLLLAAVSAGVLWQQGQLAVLALSRIDPVPEVREMIAAEHDAEAAAYLDFFMEYDYVNQDLTITHIFALTITHIFAGRLMRPGLDTEWRRW